MSTGESIRGPISKLIKCLTFFAYQTEGIITNTARVANAHG